MPFPIAGKFILQQNGSYVARTKFNILDSNGKTRQSSTTGNQLVDAEYYMDPGDLGVKEGEFVQYYLWVMAGYDQTASEWFTYEAGSLNAQTYTSTSVTIHPHLTYNGEKTLNVSHPVSVTQLQTAAGVANKICADIQKSYNNRSGQHPTLTALANDPMQVLIDNGIPEDYFSKAIPELLNE